MHPVRAVPRQQAEEVERRKPLPNAQEAEQIWERAEKRASDMQAESKGKTTKGK